MQSRVISPDNSSKSLRGRGLLRATRRSARRTDESQDEGLYGCTPSAPRRAAAGHKRIRSPPGGNRRFVLDVTAGRTARDEKTAPRTRVIVRGGDGAAHKVVRDLSAVLSFAARRGLVPNNPSDRAAVRKTDNRRDRFLTLDEVKRLGKAFDALEAGRQREGYQDRPLVGAYRLSTRRDRRPPLV